MPPLITPRAAITVLKEAGNNGLAMMFSDLLRQNLDQHPERINIFNALKARIVIEARDIQTIVGLEFKQGRLTISGNILSQSNLHIIADSATVLDLCLLKIKFGLPYLFDAKGFKVLKKLATRQLVIKGMFCHLSTLIKLTKLVSVTKN